MEGKEEAEEASPSLPRSSNTIRTTYGPPGTTRPVIKRACTPQSGVLSNAELHPCFTCVLTGSAVLIKPCAARRRGNTSTKSERKQENLRMWHRSRPRGPDVRLSPPRVCLQHFRLD